MITLRLLCCAGESRERHCLRKLFTANWSPLFCGLFALVFLGLVCCRQAGQPHWVTLTWKPPAPTGAAVGYNIYRATTSGGPYVVIASRVSGPPYEDRIVISGRTYFYVVTAVDGAGHESRFSGEVRAQVP
jgi:hypothetical protein